MIKRRFYRVEHGEGDAPSPAASSSSSFATSSDEEEAGKEEWETEEHDEGSEDINEEDGGGDEKVRGEPEESGPQSGYESEESSGNEIDCNPSGAMMNGEQDNADGRIKHASIVDEESEKGIPGASQMVPMTLASSRSTASPSQPDLLDCVIRLKTVFKCKLCPRIICLSEETMRTHLKSKRHGRSEKLFKEGRLKLMLNDDGEIVEETETHAERHARTVVAAQNAANQKNKNRGRQRQRNRSRKKVT
ncbi:hypothetical protein EJ110_NYTH31668 [Nymphaea thermarum]|nr:hypothetical protein EJ110_NYTH31668 [Nymphaea thermarum]